MQDPKYDFQNGQVINRATGEAIPADEPVFVFRARDRFAVAALHRYMNAVNMTQGQSDHYNAVARRAEEFEVFAVENPDRMRDPTTPAPEVEAEADTAVPVTPEA